MADRAERTGLEIAVVGMAGRFPGASSVDELWSNLERGVESITFFTPDELEAAGVPRSRREAPNFVGAAGILRGFDLFDASFFGYSPREASRMDPQQRVFLETAWHALENAGISPASFRRPIGVYAGSGWNAYAQHVLGAAGSESSGDLEYSAITGNDKDFLATRVSYKLNLEGPSLSVQTACSTSLVAIHLACQALISGECDAALAGGVAIRLPHISGYLFQDEGIQSPDGHCRAFDAAARGSVPGSGAAAVVLRRLEDALEDGDTIHAVVKGTAINNDGSSKVGFTAPRPDGQAQVIRSALSVAGTSADTIGYVEAHGTGTILGDPIEIEALTRAFRQETAKRSFCGIGSIKTNLGHLDAAAGVAGFIKAVLCVKHGRIPPSLHFHEPNPRIDFAGSPFFVERVLREWSSKDTPRRAGVSSFGIGGTNAHAILEEAPRLQSSAPRPKSRHHLFLLSAKDPSALVETRESLGRRLESSRDLDLEDVAHTLRVGRTHFSRRASFVADGSEGVLAALRSRTEGRAAAADARVGFLFPGQGSQHEHMGRGLYEAEPEFRKHMDRGAAILKPLLGADLREVLYGRVEGAGLDDTRIAQPAIFLVSYAAAQLWASVGVRPVALLGHSVGEYVAACLSGVFSFEDALTLVAERGLLMARASAGAMLAVPLGPSEIDGDLDGRIEIAALNAPDLTVVSGPLDAVTRLEESLRGRGIEPRRLRTSHAFHSAAMDPVLDAFAEAVSRVHRGSPKIPFVSNVTGTWVSADEARDPAYWARHLRSAVRFSEGLAALREKATVLLEVGPGTTLTSLARRRSQSGKETFVFSSMRHPDLDRSDRAVWLESVGELWSSGVDVVPNENGGRRVPLPGYPFRSERHWVERGQVDGDAMRRLPFEKWFSVPSWQRLPTPARDWRSGLRELEGLWVIFEDSHGIGTDFADHLEAAGQRVARVRLTDGAFARIDDGSFVLSGKDAEGHEALFRALDRPRRVVHFWNVGPRDERTGGPFESVLSLIQALARQNALESCPVTVVTSELEDVFGSEALCPERAMVLGPVRVAPLEFPGARVNAVDIVFPEGTERARSTSLLLRTLMAESLPPVVAIRGEHVWSQHFLAAPLDPSARFPLATNGVYLITGGTGGIGLALAEHLARTERAKLILTGTTALPERADWNGYLEKEEAGAFSRLNDRLAAADERIAVRPSPRYEDYEELQDSLDSLTARYALRILGPAIEKSDGGAIAIDEIARRLGVAEKMSSYFRMLVRSTCDAGFASIEGNDLRLLLERKSWPDPESLEREIRDRHPDFLPILELLSHCLQRIGSVLRDEIEPLSVLYGDPGRDFFRAGVETTLKHSRTAVYQPLLVELLSRLAEERPGLRVLEVGGGEGILTEALLPVLEGRRALYHFTDIGKSFVVQAEKKARERGIDWMRFGRLDISRPGAAQGFGPAQFDLILGFNVVHATPHVGRTLAHLEELLAPGGILALQESVQPRRWVDAIWGLTEGWWLFDDGPRRTSSPLLDVESWETVFREAGFTGVSSYPRGAARARTDSAVMLGFKAGDAADESTPGYRIRKLLAIERLGAELEVARADVSDRNRMEEVVVRAEKRFGHIHGVIHAALVLNDGAMELKTLQATEKVFAPKVRGTLVLKEIFEKRGLDFFAIFSSLVSVLGGKGQVDYCAASNFQDAFARAEQGKLAKRVVSIDWGAWRETGKARRAELSKGVHPANVLPDGMSTAEGLEAFAIALGASMPQILVSPVPLQASSMPPRRAEPKAPLPPAEEPLTEGERVLAEIWRELLGLENMGIHDNFFELGADSVISLQFIARAKKEGFHFTNAQVFELQTVAELLSAKLRGDEEEA